MVTDEHGFWSHFLSVSIRVHPWLIFGCGLASWPGPAELYRRIAFGIRSTGSTRRGFQLSDTRLRCASARQAADFTLPTICDVCLRQDGPRPNPHPHHRACRRVAVFGNLPRVSERTKTTRKLFYKTHFASFGCCPSAHLRQHRAGAFARLAADARNFRPFGFFRRLFQSSRLEGNRFAGRELARRRRSSVSAACWDATLAVG